MILIQLQQWPLLSDSLEMRHLRPARKSELLSRRQWYALLGCWKHRTCELSADVDIAEHTCVAEPFGACLDAAGISVARIRVTCVSHTAGFVRGSARGSSNH